MRTSHHVVPSGGGWSVKKGGSDRASKTFPTKGLAVDFARNVSRNQHSELYIHRKDGTIQQKDSHGGDHYPPKG